MRQLSEGLHVSTLEVVPLNCKACDPVIDLGEIIKEMGGIKYLIVYPVYEGDSLTRIILAHKWAGEDDLRFSTLLTYTQFLAGMCELVIAVAVMYSESHTSAEPLR